MLKNAFEAPDAL